MINNIPQNHHEYSLYKINYKNTYSKFKLNELHDDFLINFLIHLSDGSVITIKGNSLYQWNSFTFTKRVKKYKDQLDIKHIIEIANSESKNILLAYSTANILKILCLSTLDIIHSFDNHEWEITSILNIPPNKVITSSNDNTIKMFDYITGDYLLNFNAHIWVVNKIIVLYSESNKIASCSTDRSIKVWDIEDEVCSTVLEGHEDGVTDICESEEGKIISVGEDRCIKIWNWKKAYCEYTIECEDYEFSSIWWIGSQKFMTFGEGSLCIWDYANRKKILVYEMGGGMIKGISLGKRIVQNNILIGVESVYVFWIGQSIELKATSNIQ